MRNCEVCGKELYHSMWERILYFISIEVPGYYGYSRELDEYRMIDKDGEFINRTIFLCKKHGDMHVRNCIKTLGQLIEERDKKDINIKIKKRVIEVLKNERKNI